MFRVIFLYQWNFEISLFRKKSILHSNFTLQFVLQQLALGSIKRVLTYGQMFKQIRGLSQTFFWSKFTQFFLDRPFHYWQQCVSITLKWCSLQKRESKFSPKKFYEIDPRLHRSVFFTVELVILSADIGVGLLQESLSLGQADSVLVSTS